MAQGFHRRSEIAAHAVLPDQRQVDHYITTLMELGLVERRLPLSRRPSKLRYTDCGSHVPVNVIKPLAKLPRQQR